MKKTKTQQFSKFFLKDLKTKKTIYNKENYIEESNISSWYYIFLIGNWQIFRALYLLFSFDNSIIYKIITANIVLLLIFINSKSSLKNIEKIKAHSKTSLV